MMSGNTANFGDAANVVDWNAHNQSQVGPYQNNQNSDSVDRTYKNISYSPETTNTFLGSISNDAVKNAIAEAKNPNTYKEAIGFGVGGGGMEVAGKLGGELAQKTINPAIQKGIQYLQPEKKAQELISSLGEGTSKETIEELGKRLQFGKQSATEEALIPKKELYSQAGKENVYDVPKLSLPEGNIGQFSQMFDEGEKFNNSQTDALSKALKDYRSGKMTEEMKEIGGDPEDIFIHKASDILNIPELKDVSEDKIRDVLSMPTKRESAYFSDKDVTEPYSKKGKLIELHNTYENKPILNNYDDLQSALKKELRKQNKLAESGSDVAIRRAEQLEANVANLDKDQKAFSDTLPDNLKKLDLDWRTKYATNVPKYEESGNAIRKLASGNWQEVNADQIIKSFIYDNKKTREVLKDIGPSAAKNVLYLALQKTGANDAEALGKKILELKNIKGFDKFIDKDLETQANRLIAQHKHANLIKNALKVSGGAAAGGMIAGPFGAVAGAALPFGKDAIKLALKKYKK